MSSLYNCSAELRLGLLYSLKNIPIRQWPFEHFFGQDSLPPELVDDIQKHWPEKASLKSLSETKRASEKYRDRFVISLSGMLQNLDPDTPRGLFWRCFGEAIQSDSFILSVIDWLWPRISSTRSLPEKIELFSDCVLTEDFEGYDLGPHTDAPNRLVTMLWFLPTSPAQSFAGTSLYVPNPEMPVLNAPSPVHFCRSNFRRVFTAPFSPGACLGFVVGSNSFHGVEQLRGFPGSRRQIQYSVRFRAV